MLTADNQLYALDSASGRPLWRHAGFSKSAGLLGGPSPDGRPRPGRRPYSSAEVYAIRLDNGRPLWSDTVERPRRTQALDQITDIEAMPVIDGEDVYIAGYGGQMAAIDARRGIRHWDIDIASTETPWVAGDFIYLLTAGRGGHFAARQWPHPLGQPLPRLVNPDDLGSTPIVWSGPILVGDRLLVAGSHGQAITLSPYTGEILGRQAARPRGGPPGGRRRHRLHRPRTPNSSPTADPRTARPASTLQCPSPSPSSADRTSANPRCSIAWSGPAGRWSIPRPE